MRENTLSPRKVFFATYMPPRKIDGTLFAACGPRTLRGLSTLSGGPGGSVLFAFFCNFLLQVPAEYDINGVLKCFEREVLRRKPAQERTGRRLQAGLSGAAVFARELPRGNARTGRPPLSGKRVRGSVPRSWVVPRKPYAFRPLVLG